MSDPDEGSTDKTAAIRHHHIVLMVIFATVLLIKFIAVSKWETFDKEFFDLKLGDIAHSELTGVGATRYSLLFFMNTPEILFQNWSRPNFSLNFVGKLNIPLAICRPRSKS